MNPTTSAKTGAASTEGLGPDLQQFTVRLRESFAALPARAPQALLEWGRALPHRAPGALRGIPAGLRAVGRGLRQLPGALFEFALRLNAEPGLRFRTAAWSFGVIFAGLFVLTGLNPFALLAPFLGYEPPRQDNRRLVRLYGAEAGAGQATPAPRLLYLGGDLEKDIRRLAAATGRPLEITQKSGADYQELESLPEFHQAIRKIWFLDESNQGRLLIDLRGATLDRELERFLEGRSDANEDSERFYQDAYFSALTASIFRLSPDVASVEYLIDGRRRSRTDMRFDLSKRYLRGQVEPAAVRNPNEEPAS